MRPTRRHDDSDSDGEAIEKAEKDKWSGSRQCNDKSRGGIDRVSETTTDARPRRPKGKHSSTTAIG